MEEVFFALRASDKLNLTPVVSGLASLRNSLQHTPVMPKGLLPKSLTSSQPTLFLCAKSRIFPEHVAAWCMRIVEYFVAPLQLDNAVVTTQKRVRELIRWSLCARSAFVSGPLRVVLIWQNIKRYSFDFRAQCFKKDVILMCTKLVFLFSCVFSAKELQPDFSRNLQTIMCKDSESPRRIGVDCFHLELHE